MFLALYDSSLFDAHLTVNLSDVKDIVNPLSKVEAGLQAAGADVPLEAVHIRAKLVDLAARVHSLPPPPLSYFSPPLFSHHTLPHPPIHSSLPPTQVIVHQAYKNRSTIPIEAKYVFPLDDMAAGEGGKAIPQVQVFLLLLPSLRL